MKLSTLNKIARLIHSELRREDSRTCNQMWADLERAAGTARSKREAAYLIATEVFDLIDEEDEDRRKINDILCQFDGAWMPTREEETAA
jgi:hypothetical protein